MTVAKLRVLRVGCLMLHKKQLLLSLLSVSFASAHVGKT